MINTFGFLKEEILQCSAKTGEGISDLVSNIIKVIPSPSGETNFTRALVFDSKYDQYKGIINYVRVFDGEIESGSNLKTINSQTNFSANEIGIFTPEQEKKTSLKLGEVGYIYTGLKEFNNLPVGETITNVNNTNISAIFSGCLLYTSPSPRD